MNRLEKKCFIGSVAFHGLLAVVLVFGSAFLSSSDKYQKIPPIITMHAPPTDRDIASGGNPNANPPPAAPPKPEPPPPQPDPPPVREPVKHKEDEPEPQPKPPKEVVKTPDKEKTPTPKDKAIETAKTTKPPLNLKSVRRTNDLTAAQKEMAAKRDAAEKQRKEEWNKYAAQQRAMVREFGNIVGNVTSGLGKNTVAEPIGPGAQAYANYASLIIERYKAAVYASQPQSDQDADAIIRVVVARDGTVRSSQWVQRTSNPILNKAVDRAMSSVRSLPAFPAEAKDSERTFNITIAFEAKRVSG
jgi:TonB family protein